MIGIPAVVLAVGLFLAGVRCGSKCSQGGAGSSDTEDSEGLVVVPPSGRSLVHLSPVLFGHDDVYMNAEEIAPARKHMLSYLNTRQEFYLHKALSEFDRVVKDEHFPSEGATLEWFCDYFSLGTEEQKKLRRRPEVAAYVDFFTDDDNAHLRRYLSFKVSMSDALPGATADVENEKVGGYTTRDLETFLKLLSPARDPGEKPAEHMAATGIGNGDVVVDLGSGPGYFTFRISRLVGRGGRVYALDIMEIAVEYLKSVVGRYKIENVIPKMSEFADIGLDPDLADYVLLHSVYSVVYLTMDESQRGSFMDSIRNALKRDGKLIIIDNDPSRDDNIADGPRIHQDLFVAQLAHHGFRLVESHSIIPQRYLLIFAKDGN